MTIEDDALLASHIFISDNRHGYSRVDIPYKYQPLEGIAPVVVGRGCWIGEHVVIMSVVVHPDYQRQGHAGRLMRHFIDAMRALGKADIYLICQRELIPMYAAHGFVHLGPSNSDHGGLSWHEMSLTLSS